MSQWHWMLAAGCIVVLLSTSAASACKCAVVSRDQTIASVPMVFEGRIVKIETQGRAQVTTMTVVRSKTLLVGGHSAGRGTVSVRRCTMFNLNP